MRRLALLPLAVLLTFVACDTADVGVSGLRFVEAGDAIGTVTARPTWQTSCGDEGCSTRVWFGDPFPETATAATFVGVELPANPSGTLRVVYPSRSGLSGPGSGEAYVIVRVGGVGGRHFYSRSGVLTVRRRASRLVGSVEAALADTSGLDATLAGTFDAVRD